MNIEDRLIRGIDARRKNKTPEDRASEIINRAHAKAKDIFRKNTIDPNGFSDLYGRDVIQEDAEKLRSVLSDIAKKNRKSGQEQQIEKSLRISEIFEAIVLDGIASCSWMGENADVSKTCVHDDVFNGIDLLVEFSYDAGNTSHLGLAIDVSFSKTLGRKFERIKREIDSGKLAKIKYAVSKTRHFRGELSLLPRVVASSDIQKVNNLSFAWINEGASLKKHPAQLLLLAEIELQLETFIEYGKKINKPFVVQACEQALQIIKNIQLRKSGMPKGDILEDDLSFTRMKEALRNVFTNL